MAIGVAGGILVAAACGGAAPARPTAPSTATGFVVDPATRPALPAAEGAAARLGWLAGRWVRTDGHEAWFAMGHAMVGVGLGPQAFFEVQWVTGAPDDATFVVFPGGEKRAAFRGSATAERIDVADPTNDYPRAIVYRPDDGDALRVMLSGELPSGEPAPGDVSYAPDATTSLRFERAAPDADAEAAIAELLEAERAFAAATAAGGASACEAWFAADGVAFGDGPASPADACRYLAPPDGTYLIDWWPVHAGLGPDGRTGFTIGRWRTLHPAGAVDAPGPTGTFVTIWRRHADGSWRLRFDTGLPDPA